MDTLDKFLKDKDLSRLKKGLARLGVKKFGDLFYLEMDAIAQLDANYVEKKKLEEFILNVEASKEKEKISPIKESVGGIDPTHSFTHPSPNPTFGDSPPTPPIPAPRRRGRPKFDFNGEDGNKVLEILNKLCGETPDIVFAGKIVEKELSLIDQIACELRINNPDAFELVNIYLSKFQETKHFLDFQDKLTFEQKERIRQFTQNDIPMLSNELNIVKSVIREYFLQYELSAEDKTNYSKQQEKSIFELSQFINNRDIIDINEYKRIYTHSFKWYLDVLEKDSQNQEVCFGQLFEEIIPIVFICIKCNLPLDDIRDKMIKINKNGVPKTNHEIFHLVFQNSESLVKALCIEEYSFSFPIPFCYPSLSAVDERDIFPVFQISKELWFTFPECLAIASFGLGSAGSFPIGKSYLLDQIFGTDFATTNCKNNAFHLQSIDVQFNKNFKISEDFKVAYFDCHSCVPLWAIETLCKYVNIIIIHVLEKDFLHNKNKFIKELENFCNIPSKLIVVLIRDCVDNDLEFENIPDVVYFHVLNKNCTPQKIGDLKKIFREHLHSEHEKVDRSLVENFLRDIKDEGYHDIIESKLKIENMIQTIDHFRTEDRSSIVGQDFLAYYPIFVNYMNSHNKATQETDQDEIDLLNRQCETLSELLHETNISPIVSVFLEIMECEYSSLLLLNLSKYLTEINEKFLVVPEEQLKYQYSIDIIWREALLSFKYYNAEVEDFHRYNKKLNKCFSKHILEGEPFELIDGDNLVFYSKDLDVLLKGYYKKQLEFNFRHDMGRNLKLNAAPTVISIFGPQSSGKSTLLNYCFGCKFVTSAGRCTKGVYGSLFQMKDIVNNSKILLVLDTEGSDSLERGRSEIKQDQETINFDRTIALFCLSVSQLIIINIKGDIGTEIKNLLQVCAYSLNRLKVNKVALPKIFLVLNQQSDPDVKKHAKSLNFLLESLDTTFYTAELEKVRVSDLIKITSENLFILPSAFNSEPIEGSPLSKVNSQAIKLRSAKLFAQESSWLKTKIFDAITENANLEALPFKNVSEWIQMAGLIWETCVKYQDIVRFRDLEEMAFSEKIHAHILSCIDNIIYKNEHIFQKTLENILKEIDATENYCDVSILITQKMEIFDEVFLPFKEKCDYNFNAHFQEHPQRRQFDNVFKKAKSNLDRLIIVFRKRFEDKIKFRINNVLLELKITNSIKQFRDMIEYRIDDYINFSPDEKLREFERIWEECYENESEDDSGVRNEHFEILYTNFKIECNFLEQRQSLFQLFRENNFDMDQVINYMENLILSRFMNSDDDNKEECYFCVLNQSYGDLTKMEPYNLGDKCIYLSPDSLIESFEHTYLYFLRLKTQLHGWIPKECYPFIYSCLGHYNSYEIVWGRCQEKLQILRLSSKLRDPDSLGYSCWQLLLDEVRKEAKACLDQDPQLSLTTIKRLISDLSHSIKVVNHEIKYIRTMLSDKAERELSTLVFSYSFQKYWKYQMDQRKVDKTQRGRKKVELEEYFYQTVETRKMIKGDWDTKNMRANDLKISTKFATDYVDSIKRYVLTTTETKIGISLENLKESLTVKHLLLKVNQWIDEQINQQPNIEITDINHDAIRFICDRNTLLEEIFHKDWSKIQKDLLLEIEREAKLCFEEFVYQLLEQFELLLNYFDKLPDDLKNKNCFYSDYNFELPKNVTIELIRARETPFKAMAIYLSKYLNPMINNGQMNLFLRNFKVAGVKTGISHKSILPTEKLGARLNAENFKRLTSTNVFNSELIFDIFLFISNFREVLVNQLSTYFHDSDKVNQFFEIQRQNYLKDALGCKMQCPSCGKFCEKGIHNDGTKCQITTGHQLSSMGGKVWQNNPQKTAILFMCDDYQDYMSVKIPGKSMGWSEFKLICGKEWKWDMPNVPNCQDLQKNNRDRMRKIWTKFGKGILRYYSLKGTTISYIPYNEKYMNYIFDEFFICFIIDGTGSMGTDIEKARISVSKIVQHQQRKKKNSHFRIVIYRDHCDEEIIETYPPNLNFTDDTEGVAEYLKHVRTFGGGDGPEAMLDGLATAVLKTKWGKRYDRKNLIVHIFDAPPHGDFPNYKEHSSDSCKGNCCCCNHSTLCPYDWVSDVWIPMKNLNIEYYGINTSRSYVGYEQTMKKQLGELCAEFQVCGKEQVDTAVMEVFISFDN